MVKISDCSCQCRDTGKEKQIEERALSSINKIISTEGTPYYPDGTGAVTMPIADADDLINATKVPAIESDISQMKISIQENADEIKTIQTVNDAQAREILEIKNADDNRDGEISGLGTRMTTAEGDISDLETLTAAHESNIKAIQTTDTQQNQKITANANGVSANATAIEAAETDIDALQVKATEQGQKIVALQTLTTSITKSLVSDVEVTTGTLEGSFIVSVVEEDGTKRSSDSFRYGRVGTFALEQGSNAGYVRGKLTLVDGTVITSNDFQILQISESDVYVTSITLEPDYDTGKLGGSIGYSNGNTAAINAVVVPTAPGVTSNINDLLARMSAVETTNTSQGTAITSNTTRIKALEDADVSIKSRLTSAENKNTAQDTEISSLDERVTAIEGAAGIGKFTNASAGTILGSTADGRVSANADGTGSVNGWAGKASVDSVAAVSNAVATKAEKSALDATDAKVTQIQTAVGDCFNAVDLDGSTLKFTAVDGQENSLTLPSDEWKSVSSFDVIPNDSTVLQLVGIGLALEFPTTVQIIRFKSGNSFYYNGTIAQSKEQLDDSDYYGIIYNITNAKIYYKNLSWTSKTINVTAFNWFYK